jgi:hypothetical protein
VHESNTTAACLLERFRAGSTTFPEHIQELEEERRAFCAWQRLQRIRLCVRRTLDFWPLALGLVLGLLAPQLCALLMRFGPWSVWVVFPFVALARRPELHAGLYLASALPTIVLYAQFPIEGLIVQFMQRRRVTVPGVAGQMFYLHYLGVIQLLMISQAVGQAVWR